MSIHLEEIEMKSSWCQTLVHLCLGGTDGSRLLQRPVEHCVKTSPHLERGQERSADRQPVSLGPLPHSVTGSGFFRRGPALLGSQVFLQPRAEYPHCTGCCMEWWLFSTGSSLSTTMLLSHSAPQDRQRKYSKKETEQQQKTNLTNQPRTTTKLITTTSKNNTS